MSVAADVQVLDVGAIISMYELDTSSLVNGSEDPFYMVSATNPLNASVVWQGKTYLPLPIEVNGFEWSSSGALPRPKMTVSNVDGQMSALVLLLQDLVGAKIIRHRTLVKYLDVVNFPGGVNDSADPESHFPDELYAIRRKSKETKSAIEFELGAPWDAAGILLPTRLIIANVCTWIYKSPECGYVPGPMFKADDTPTDDPAQDVCGKRLSSCKCRFGPANELSYGGFPAAGLIG